jgi:hypothetical protein
MKKFCQKFLLSFIFLVYWTEAFAMMQEDHPHAKSIPIQDKEPVYREVLIDFNSQMNPLKVIVPNKLSPKDLSRLDMRDITTSQCVPYAFKRKVFPLLKENRLDKAVLITVGFVWNNTSKHDEFCAQLKDINPEIINIIKKGKNNSHLFSKAEEETKNVLEHLAAPSVTLEEDITYDNPFVIEDLSKTLPEREDALESLYTFKELW